jgi:hypothetical protein
MDHVAGPIHILLAEREGRIWFNIICLKPYQFKDNYLVVFVCPEICYGIYPTICLEICHVGENILRNHGLPEFLSAPDANFGRP